MGLLDIKITKDQSTIATWRITEPESVLLDSLILHPFEQKKLDQITSSKRRKEWLAVRCLLKKLFPEKTPHITYDSLGKPSLSNGNKISISHSNAFVVVMIDSTTEVGIDIQCFKRNIDRGTKLFMREEELASLSQSDCYLEKLHLYWAAKEAAFKYASAKDLLVGDIAISPFSYSSKGNMEAFIPKIGLSVLLVFEVLADYFLVYSSTK